MGKNIGEKRRELLVVEENIQNGFKLSKTTTLPIIFKLDKELPYELVKRVVNEFFEESFYRGNYDFFEKMKFMIENKTSV